MKRYLEEKPDVLNVTGLSDEVHLNLDGDINKTECHILASENPMLATGNAMHSHIVTQCFACRNIRSCVQ
jgi:hypothetical protein